MNYKNYTQAHAAAQKIRQEYSSNGVDFFLAPDPYWEISTDSFKWDEATLDYNNGDYADGTGSATYHYEDISIRRRF